jgi:hypothetical protein
MLHRFYFVEQSSLSKTLITKSVTKKNQTILLITVSNLLKIIHDH